VDKNSWFPSRSGATKPDLPTSEQALLFDYQPSSLGGSYVLVVVDPLHGLFRVESSGHHQFIREPILMGNTYSAFATSGTRKNSRKTVGFDCSVRSGLFIVFWLLLQKLNHSPGRFLTITILLLSVIMFLVPPGPLSSSSFCKRRRQQL
jgi:hypothetical protein